MTYSLKEIFFTLQGEGFHAGRASVFARFSGCNLWSGREVDRAQAICTFCDTDFIGTDGPGGGKFSNADELAETIRRTWDDACQDGRGTKPFVVFTGGEPMLQLDEALVVACQRADFEVAIETNGTIAVPESVDWICVSPKPGAPLVQTEGQELKLVFPHEVQPDQVMGLNFEHFYLQPMDGPERLANTQAAVAYCQAQPRWRLSLQTHKLIGIP